MLKIENLHATVGGSQILNGISLEIPSGEVHAIMGPNGSGKSTLSYVLAGRDGYEVTQGTATLNGKICWSWKLMSGLLLAFFWRFNILMKSLVLRPTPSCAIASIHCARRAVRKS